VDGGVVNGALQRSVRLHPDPGDSFTATATVSGPGGTSKFSRSFTMPRALADADVAQIVNAGNRFSPKVNVTAAGFTDALLGKTSSCSPMTVVSGVQKMSGCLKPIEDITDIPSAERGILAPLAQELHLNQADAALMKKAVEYTDGYIAQGKALLNDQWPVVPSGAAKLLSYPQASALTSSNASIEVAGVKFGASPKGFSLDLDPKKVDIPLGQLPKPPKLPSIGGFELVGDWNIDLGKREATIKASLKLPKWITSAGIEIQNSVTLRATPDELKVEDVSVGPIKVNLGGLNVEGFKISYTKAEDTWQGQGKACILSGVCLDMVPPNGQVKITHGKLNFAGASVNFPLPGIPLFTGVNLERLGFGIGLDPTRMTGNGRIAVLKLVKLDGRLVVAFPSERTPFILKADEVGGGFPAKLYNQRFTRPTIGATAGILVSVPVLGEIGLGNGYFLYQIPNYIAVGGGVDIRILDVIRLYGNISGEANFDDEVLNLHGDEHACLTIIRDICAGAVVNISRGPNSTGGAGGCLEVGPFHVGGGIRWAHPTDPYIWPFDGCKWSRFKLDVRVSRAQAGEPRTIVVKRGQPSPTMKLYGAGGAPKVHITGPGGQSFDSTDNGLDFSPGGKIRILRFQGREANFTVIGLQNAQPGTYTVTPQAGSPPITKVERATDLPNARVSGHVTGVGSRRVLHYRVLRRDGQSIRFFDMSEGNSAKEIGHVSGGGAGSLRFSPAPGKGRRRIEAQFELQGMPAERKVVTTFRPPAPGLAKPRGLRIKRSKKGPITISWRAVSGATRYEVAVTSPTGYQRFATTRKRRAVIKLAKSVGGRVTVRALDAYRQSPVAAKSFKRLVRPTSRFRTPARCTVGKKKVTCRRA
jgi:hypothetical protein